MCVNFSASSMESLGQQRSPSQQSNHSAISYYDNGSQIIGRGGRGKNAAYPKYQPVSGYPSPRPTVTPRANFHVGELVRELRDAFKGFGTDEGIIIDIFGSCSSEQRQELKAKYQESYNQVRRLPLFLRLLTMTANF